MDLNNVTFNRTNGTGALAAANDYISGLLFYSDTLPAGFTATDRVKKIFNLQGAEDLGIVNTYGDETKSTDAEVQITQTGAAGDITSISIDDVVLGSYTVITGDAVGDIAAGLGAAINALTSQHGFNASVATDTVTITAKTGMGKATSDGTITYSPGVGSSTASITQFVGGAGSLFNVWHYHISEFFRMKPDGVLYVGIYAVPTTFDGAEATSMQNAANGELRQLGVYYPNAAFASSQLTALQTKLAALRDDNKQLFAVHHGNCYALSLATLPDVSALTASKTAINIAEDGNWMQEAYSYTKAYNPGDKLIWMNSTYSCVKSATGQAPYNTDYFSVISENIRAENGFSISTIGNQLGTIAAAEVHESIAKVEKFNLASGNNLDTAGFATGVLYKNQATSLLNVLNTYHYTFIRKFERNSGSYYSDSYTAIAETDDYHSIERNRTMDKAERLVYDALVPVIASDFNLKSDGTLTQGDIDNLENKGSKAIEAMSNNISVDDNGDSQFLFVIPPDQDVNTTKEINYTLSIIGKYIGRKIVVNNSFVVSL